MTAIKQASSTKRNFASVRVIFEFCSQFLYVMCASSGDETTSVIQAFAALGSLTLRVG